MINRRTLQAADPAELARLYPGEPVSPRARKAAADIIARVRRDGDRALRALTRRFDGATIDAIEVSREQLDGAKDRTPPQAMRWLERARTSIEAFDRATLPADWEREFTPGVRLGVRHVPFRSVGAYVPGGRASYPSTALMCVVPAKVAGVPEVVACTPPGPDGAVPPLTLAALRMAGADRVFRVGGAQAVAAMAYGTETVPRVEKLVGPGNEYVTAAKMNVRGDVEIDFPAGPSEVLVVADDSAEPGVVAAELVAQGEHDPRARAFLVCASRALADATEEALRRQLAGTPHGSPAAQAAYEIVLVPDLRLAVDVSNAVAPEHLVLMVHRPDELLAAVRAAGAVFIGPYSPVAAGDYAAGPNHVLPTGGEARLHSGLGVNHFLRGVTTQRLTREGLDGLRDTVCGLARLEGLDAHARAVERRFE